MEIKKISTEKIKPYFKNAKIHPLEQIKAIARSISQFGFNQPIVIDEKNVVIVGHGRLEAAKMLEMKEVPVLVVPLTPDQAKAYRLADNKLNESDWNMELVQQELAELAAEDYDVTITGFALIDPTINGADNEQEQTSKKYEVIVEAKSERNAQEICDQLSKMGHVCRVSKP